MFKKTLLVSSFAMFMLLFGNCSENSNPASSSALNGNNLSLCLALPGGSDSLSSAIVTLSLPGRDTISKSLFIEKDKVYGTVTNIPVGNNVHIVITIYDKNGNVIYYGEAYSNVVAGKTTDVTIRLTSAKGSLNIIGVFGNDSTLYNITGIWNIDQTNNNSGSLQFTQEGTALKGYSQWTYHTNGPIVGTVNGNSVYFTITYPQGVTGYYWGTISSDGKSISGPTTSSTKDSADWYSSKQKIISEVPEGQYGSSFEAF